MINLNIKYTFGFSFFLILLWFYYSYQFPIHPDEVNWRVIYSRFITQDLNYIGYMESCDLDNPRSIPFYFIPHFYLLSASSFFESFASYRIPQILYLSSFWLGVYLFAKKYLLSSTKISTLIFFSFIFISLTQVTSIWGVSSRPEVLILFLFSIFIFYYLYNRHDKPTLSLFFIIFVWSLVSVAHPKATYFGLFLFYFILLLNTHVFVKISLFLFVAIIAYYISDLANIVILSCPSEPLVVDQFKNYNANPLNLFFNPDYFLAEFISNFPGQLMNLLSRTPSHMLFTDNYDIGYLPGVSISTRVAIINSFIKLYYFSNFYLFIFLFFKNLSLFFTRDASPNFFILCLQVVSFVLITFNRTTNSYEAFFWFNLMLFVNLFSIIIFYKPKFNFYKSIYFFSLSIFIFFLVVFKNDLYSKVTNEDWSSFNSGPMTSSLFRKDSSLEEINTFYLSYCKSNDLTLFDDRTYEVLKSVPGSKPFTYFMFPFSFYDDSLFRADSFLNNYSSASFLGNCGFAPEVPPSLKLNSTLSSLHICCWKK